MLISKAKYKLAAQENFELFVNFCHYYKISMNAMEKRDLYLMFDKNQDPEKQIELQKNFENAVKLAIQKLFHLDAAFYKRYDEHFITRLETFGDYYKVLFKIREFHCEFDAEKKSRCA